MLLRVDFRISLTDIYVVKILNLINELCEVYFFNKLDNITLGYVFEKYI